MTLRRLFPLTVLALSVGTGCQHSASASPPAEATAQAPAPFATPPVLAGTPDVATLVAKVKPAVVNITTVQEVRAPQADMPISPSSSRSSSSLPADACAVPTATATA